MHNPFDPGYYRAEELRALGFARVGEGTCVARNCTIVGLENIYLGDAVRIDGYTTIIADKGLVRIGSHVHICSSSVLGARGGIEIGDFSSLSHGVKILSAIDDFSGELMTNSTLPEELVRIQVAPIRLGKHVPVGTGAILLPGSVLETGAAISAMSVVVGTVPEWMICGGNPAKPIRPRSRNLLTSQGQV